MEIGIWGDSITYGGGEEGWVAHLRRSLSDKDIDVYNRGICGDTTEDVLKRFAVESGALEAKIVVFAFGINDSKYPNRGNVNKVPFENFKQNMNNLVKQARTNAEKVVLVGLTDVDETVIGGSSLFLNNTIQLYDEYISNLAKREGLLFIPMRGLLDPHNDLVDGLHPNAVGYQKIFEKVHHSLGL